MKFTAKIRKIGNSLGILIPKNVITFYKINDVIEFDVITSAKNVMTIDKKVITQSKNVITNELEKTKEDLKVITPKQKLVFNMKRGGWE